MVTLVQILDEAVFISNCTNALWKGMNFIIPSPAIGKIVMQTGLFFNLGMTTSIGEGKLWIQRGIRKSLVTPQIQFNYCLLYIYEYLTESTPALKNG